MEFQYSSNFGLIKIIKSFLLNWNIKNETNCKNVVSLKFKTDIKNDCDSLLGEADYNSFISALDSYTKVIFEITDLRSEYFYFYHINL